MCGITAFLGNKATETALEMTLCQLSRGTDGAGVAYVQNGTLCIAKAPCHPVKFGREFGFFMDITSKVAISHNRMPSKGKVSVENTHPFVDCKGRFALIHNGTISNTEVHSKRLKEAGHKIEGDTDSEVYCHLICEQLDQGKTMLEALRVMIEKQEIATILVITREGEIWGLKGFMPLEICILKNKETNETSIAIASEQSSIRNGVVDYSDHEHDFAKTEYGDIIMCKDGKLEIIEHHPHTFTYRATTYTVQDYEADWGGGWSTANDKRGQTVFTRGGNKFSRNQGCQQQAKTSTKVTEFPSVQKERIKHINELRRRRNLPDLTEAQVKELVESDCMNRDKGCPVNCVGRDGLGNAFACYHHPKDISNMGKEPPKTTRPTGCADYDRSPPKNCPTTKCDPNMDCFRAKGCAHHKPTCPEVGSCMETRECYVKCFSNAERKLLEDVSKVSGDVVQDIAHISQDIIPQLEAPKEVAPNGENQNQETKVEPAQEPTVAPCAGNNQPGTTGNHQDDSTVML